MFELQAIVSHDMDGSKCLRKRRIVTWTATEKEQEPKRIEIKENGNLMPNVPLYAWSPADCNMKISLSLSLSWTNWFWRLILEFATAKESSWTNFTAARETKEHKSTKMKTADYQKWKR